VVVRERSLSGRWRTTSRTLIVVRLVACGEEMGSRAHRWSGLRTAHGVGGSTRPTAAHSPSVLARGRPYPPWSGRPGRAGRWTRGSPALCAASGYLSAFRWREVPEPPGVPHHDPPSGHRRRVIKVVEVMELVIFDCDRVLIDSDRILLRVQAEMLCEFRPHSKPPETVGRRRDFESADISGPWKQPSI